MSPEYKTCLGDYEPILPELARIIDAPYASGDYTKYEDDFFNSRTEEGKYWELIGTRENTMQMSILRTSIRSAIAKKF